MFTPKYLDRQARANSVDLGQKPRNVASDEGLNCLSLIQQLNLSPADPGYALPLQTV